MDQETLEKLYVTGEYSLVLEEINKSAYNDPLTKFNKIEKAICLSYHSRALIRLGEVHEAENLIREIPKMKFDESFSISNLIDLTSIINLQITQGEVNDAIKNGITVTSLIEQRENKLSSHPRLLSFWGSFLYYWIGIAYFYQLRNDLARINFQRSIVINQTNLFIKAKSLYYTAFLELENGDTSKFFDLLDDSLVIYHSLDAKQGIGWVTAWQGQFFLQKGDFHEANRRILEASELFRSIGDMQGINLVNSLTGLMFYQQGKLEQAEEILEQAFDSSIKIGNPMIASYCLIPLILLYIEFGNRSKAQKCIQEFQDSSGKSNSVRVKVHRQVAEAIFLKSSSRFSDKAQAQKKFLELLNERDEESYVHGPYVFLTSDTTFSFLVLIHLAELYLEEFKLSEDKLVMKEARRLIDNHIQNTSDKKFSPELLELSLLKAKLLIVEGEIKKAIAILDQAKQDARTYKLHRLEEKIGLEITRIEEEFQKWDAAISVRERIKVVEIERYLKEAQKMKALHQ